MKIYMFYGGKSAEHEISILSAHSILNHIYYDYYQVQPVYITRAGNWITSDLIDSKEAIPSHEDLRFYDHELGPSVDTGAKPGRAFDLNELVDAENAIAFPVLHGPNGEDGTIQGFFETVNIPYVGGTVLSSAIGMDKYMSKLIFAEAGIPQVPYIRVLNREWVNERDRVLNEVEAKLSLPIFVKPANLGSSVGISKVSQADELAGAIDLAFRYDASIIIEQGVEARELEVAVLGNEDIHTSIPGELVKERGFYDYESKYIDNTVTLQIPAQVDDQIVNLMREYSARAFSLMGGRGLSRFDFFLTKDNQVFINEVNTFPGFTQFSMYPLLWEKTGLSYGDLIEELIQLGLAQYESRQAYTSEDR